MDNRLQDTARSWARSYQRLLSSLGWKVEVCAMIDYDKLVPSGFFSVRLPASIICWLSCYFVVWLLLFDSIAVCCLLFSCYYSTLLERQPTK